MPSRPPLQRLRVVGRAPAPCAFQPSPPRAWPCGGGKECLRLSRSRQKNSNSSCSRTVRSRRAPPLRTHQPGQASGPRCAQRAWRARGVHSPLPGQRGGSEVGWLAPRHSQAEVAPGGTRPFRPNRQAAASNESCPHGAKDAARGQGLARESR